MKLAHKLKHRIQIKEAVQEPNEQGGFDIDYQTMITVWAGIKDVTDKYAKYVRGETVAAEDYPTHEFIVRKTAVQNIGRQTALAFSIAFDSIKDLMPLKSDFFIFLQQGSNVKGRLFRILELARDENYKEFIKFRAREIEEQGTGYPA